MATARGKEENDIGVEGNNAERSHASSVNECEPVIHDGNGQDQDFSILSPVLGSSEILMNIDRTTLASEQKSDPSLFKPMIT